MLTPLETYRQPTSKYDCCNRAAEILQIHALMHGLGDWERSGSSLFFKFGEVRCELSIEMYHNSALVIEVWLGVYTTQIITSLNEAIEDVVTLATEQGL